MGLMLVGAVILGGLLLPGNGLNVGVDTQTPRDHHQVELFRQAHPCPSTSSTKGPCPGFVVDHMKPLCDGGADTPENMAWQEYRYSLIKDQLERDLCRCKKGTP